MKKILKRLLPTIIILFFVLGIFYFDRGLLTGHDPSYYMDLSYLLSRGSHFLVDIIDYRLPVFPLIFSPIFKLNLSDFENRYIMFIFIYGIYSIATYLIALHITKSRLKSLAVSLITLISISSRQFDAPRNIAIPLFYDTLELFSVLIILKYILDNTQTTTKKKTAFFFTVSGILASLAFTGRQVHIFAPLLMLFCFVWIITKKKKETIKNCNPWIMVSSFASGFMVIGLGILWIFYTPNINFFYLSKKWLIDFSALAYATSETNIVFDTARKLFFTTHTGLSELRALNKGLPLFWLVYIMGIGYFYKLLVNKEDNFREKLKYFYRNHGKKISFVIAIGLMAITTVLVTGSGAVRYEGPFFAFYATLLAFLLTQVDFKNSGERMGLLMLLFVFMTPSLAHFIKAERKSYLASQKQKNQILFSDKTALAIKEAMDGKDEIVLVVGGVQPVGRIAKYQPFGGFINDTLLYISAKLFNNDPNYANTFFQKLKNVNIVYKLPDYPNLSIGINLRENEMNTIYRYIENDLASNFKIFATIQSSNSFPYNYTKEAIIYKRIHKSKLEPKQAK